MLCRLCGTVGESAAGGALGEGTPRHSTAILSTSDGGWAVKDSARALDSSSAASHLIRKRGHSLTRPTQIGNRVAPLLVALDMMFVCVVLLLVMVGALALAGTVAAVGHVAVAALVYLLHGGPRLTPLGMYAFGSAVFLGIPYFVSGPLLRITIDPIASVYAFLAFSAVVFLAALFRPRDDARLASLHADPLDGFRMDPLVLWLIAVGLLVGFVLETSGLFSSLHRGVMYFAVTYLSLAAVTYWRRNAVVRSLALWLTVTATIGAFYLLSFAGYGRLNVVTLVFCSLAVLTASAGTRWWKAAPLIISPLAIYWAGVVRSPFGGFSAAEFSSALSPLITFSDILSLVDLGAAPLLLGTSYLYPFYFWVPRAFWAAKPDGIGNAYVRWIAPELAGTDHSLAVSYLGEGVANFGPIGVLASVLLAASLVIVLSRGVSAMSITRRPGREAWFLFCGAVVLQTSILDFVWADSNTFTHRGLVRFAVVGGYALVTMGVRLVFRVKPGNTWT